MKESQYCKYCTFHRLYSQIQYSSLRLMITSLPKVVYSQRRQFAKASHTFTTCVLHCIRVAVMEALL